MHLNIICQAVCTICCSKVLLNMAECAYPMLFKLCTYDCDSTTAECSTTSITARRRLLMHSMRTSNLRRQVVDVREVIAAGAQVRGPLLQRVEPAVQVGEATPAAHLHALHAPCHFEVIFLCSQQGLSCKTATPCPFVHAVKQGLFHSMLSQPFPRRFDESQLHPIDQGASRVHA